MKTEYLHLQEVIEKIKQANKDIKDDKAYKEKVIEGLGIPVFFSDQNKIQPVHKSSAGEKNEKD